jgi:hypothetical protein
MHFYMRASLALGRFDGFCSYSEFIRYRSVPGEYEHFSLQNRGRPSYDPENEMAIFLKTALTILIKF